MQVDLQPAYLLHSRPYRDSSLIIDCLTPDYGRLGLVVKGARSTKSRQRHLYQSFKPLLISWRGRSDLKNLIYAEENGQSCSLVGNYLFSGLYINELLTRLLPERDSCEGVYKLYQQTLQTLQLQPPLEPTLRSFEFALLSELGYAVDLQFEADGVTALDTGASYQWMPELGWSRSLDTQRADVFSGSALQAIASGDYQEEFNLQAAKRLSRLLLRPLLGDKPLRSRELFTMRKYQ